MSAPATWQERAEAAEAVCRYLVADYNKGEDQGGEINWEDIDATADLARSVVGLDWRYDDEGALTQAPAQDDDGEGVKP